MRLRKLLTSTSIATAVAALPISPVLAQDSAGGQATQGGSGETINLVTAWDYEPLYSQGISVERLLDAEVYDASEEDVAGQEDEVVAEGEGEAIGEVENLVVSAQGSVTGIIIETGGFLDIGDTHLLYPFDQARIASTDAVYVEIKEDAIEEYSLFPEVEDQPIWGQQWRITDLINDYAALGGEVPYGMVEDVIINQTGNILAVVVEPDVTYGYAGYYAWPYYGYGYGFEPGLPYYSVPYSEEEVADLAAFETQELQGAADGAEQ